MEAQHKAVEALEASPEWAAYLAATAAANDAKARLAAIRALFGVQEDIDSIDNIDAP